MFTSYCTVNSYCYHPRRFPFIDTDHVIWYDRDFREDGPDYVTYEEARYDGDIISGDDVDDVDEDIKEYLIDVCGLSLKWIDPDYEGDDIIFSSRKISS